MNSKLDREARISRNREMRGQYLNGMPTAKIAELWDVTPARVVQILGELGVEMRRPRGPRRRAEVSAP
jgi:hypothetical protein